MKIKDLKWLIICLPLISNNTLSAHCQIPCGIYNDGLRVIQIEENFKTIEKAMNKIIILSSENDPYSSQQIIRWTISKEEHATDTQRIISDYFLAQRIKIKDQDYVNQLMFLHKIYVNAMKCKQNIDLKYVSDGRKLLENFSELYFDEHGKNHLKSLRKLH
jgi:nickel superoxide dismutase